MNRTSDRQRRTSIILTGLVYVTAVFLAVFVAVTVILPPGHPRAYTCVTQDHTFDLPVLDSGNGCYPTPPRAPARTGISRTGNR